jgi:hypothetical protein
MTRGNKFMLGATVEPQVVKELDAIRGEIPRSRIVERALNWYLKEVERNRRLQGVEVGTTHQAAAITNTYRIGGNDASG